MLKKLYTYLKNILIVIVVDVVSLIVAIFAPKHLSSIIVETNEELHKEIKKTKKAKKSK